MLPSSPVVAGQISWFVFVDHPRQLALELLFQDLSGHRIPMGSFLIDLEKPTPWQAVSQVPGVIQKPAVHPNRSEVFQ